ncbi:DUF2844 domain-containing protein [Variovorax sp. EL159]|uniref:DUF2844 domain-containing protein n=1 Tax=Variovorax sp. EL159 TaxID=1566270 RepID=UPI000882D3DC|nr:DUF2844 domain-containing protein [Variovorax sp. EL159]SCX67297.1 Protein of unknown function [Variovorax sp. EL159]
MKSRSQKCHAHRAQRAALLGGFALALGAAGMPSAFAELGGAPTLSAASARSVQRLAVESNKASSPATSTEQATGGSATTGTTPSWTTRETTLPDGLIEREYLTADGVVFAVAWRGSHRPELSVLLGTQYATQMSRNARALRLQGKGSHGTTSQNDETFAVQASTHQRSSTGVAWLPKLLPAGVSPDALSIPPGS